MARAGASVSLIGFNDRTPQQRDDNIEVALKEFGTMQESALSEATTWIAGSWDYAASKMPGWRDIVAGTKTPEEVRDEYLVGSGAALYVIAGVVAACRFSGVDYKPAIDEVANLA